ncbi:unnamed protein product [Acanthoscelides obtectus]|uniref:Uncharacterized protein n=1 Tax=Acanthoscelides obtectus TaxID=200917 RepID=A0A9P0K9H0_ACAOB|nr:unnamed protein product [Acanthoscelides obtectus]CAK1662571.1 Protein takeout [Acanthoscelides obtectus]
MASKCFVVAVAVSFTVTLIEAARLPSDWGRCHRTDPDFEGCLRQNIEDAIQKLKNGSPELGLSTFDPLDIPQLVIGEGKGTVNVAQHFNDLQLHGLTGSKVISSSVDFKNKKIYARSVTPYLRLQGHYTMKGRILLLPIVGDGQCNITLINTKINHTLTAEEKIKKGKVFWTFKEYTITLEPEMMSYNFDNLFDGEQALGDNINKVLNENWSEVFADVREGYEKGIGAIFHNLANRVFSIVPLDEIYLQ